MSEQSADPTELVEQALARATAAPQHHSTSVLVTEDSTANMRWASNTLTTNGVTTGQAVSLAVAVRAATGVCLGVVSRRGVGLGDIDSLVDEALAVASQAPPAEDAADQVPGEADADWNLPADVTGPAVLAGLASGLGEAFGSARSDGSELFGYAEHSMRTTWLGTSAGARRRHTQPAGTVELTGKSHQRSRSTYACQATRDFADVDVLAMADQVRTRLGWQARRVDAAPGRYDVVLPPTTVADLMVYLYWSGDARSAHEGRSVFSRRGGGTRVGEQLTDVPLSLTSDPGRAGQECEPFIATPSSSPFASVFDNGVPTPAATWIDAGRLAALPTTRHTAALTGLPLTPVVDNLQLTAPDGDGDVDTLVADIDRGLLLTSTWYIREVDPTTLLLTGLTRDGVYLVEGGEVVGATNNFRFNESPVDLLARVGAVGRTMPTLSREWGEFFPRTAMPALRVRDFNMSSTSQAS